MGDPSFILLAVGSWRIVPTSLRQGSRPGTEVFLLVPVILAGAWLAFYLGGILESALLSGDYRSWLLSTLGLTYDQRNSLVVGFAVIPRIFTTAEDSLSNVPQHLTAASLALGATRWQTAIRVVLPTASAGIFSAIMIGFGRAVGETMIVLMATGDTPVMDWSPFNGFRALSANIAGELPEAPDGGTLYLTKVWEFVAGDPRESDTEGGVFPAIFGTVMLVMIMSLAVTPLGIIA